ncbi:MAG: gliding motility-associated C-terminal domain-containing protein [Bacteroidales bacterium]
MSEIVRFSFLAIFFMITGGGVLLSGQTPLITGINRYAKVTAVSTDYVTVDDVSDFSAGDTVMIMQMSGVRIAAGPDLPGNYQNTIGTPGKYEISIVSTVNGGLSRVSFSRNLLNAYNPQGKVQLIKVRSYSNAVINSELSCQDWDSSAVRGGVLVFLVKGTLTMNADINVNGRGFIGGKVALGLGDCQLSNDSIRKFSYSIWSRASGYKGDGIGIKTIADVPLYPGYARGKGVNMTGGGGGNGHLSGGGGGSNYGAGSEGDVEVPVCASLTGGNGGYSVSPYSTNGGVFMGGGGGSSVYLSTPNTSAGGDGGGVVIILADSINGNGRLISALGIEPDANTVANAGAGGGGGGGSVVVSARYFTSDPVLSANGGKGGNNNAGQNGAGGGGGGGLIWTTGAFPGTATVTGGMGGTHIAGDPDKDGSPGAKWTNLRLPLNGFLFNAVYSSRTLNQVDSICEGMLPPKLTGTRPTGGSGTYTYKWQRSPDNNTWSDISGATNIDYISATPEAVTVWFRRIVDDGTGITDLSKSVQIIVHPYITGNIVGSDTTLCYNQDPEELYPLNSGPGGGTGLFSYAWEQSPDNSVWAAASGANSNPKYNPQALTATAFYHRTVFSGACTDISSPVTVTILPSITGNNIQADQTICQGSLFANLTGDTPGGGASPAYTYRWMSSTDNLSWSNATAPNSGINYDPQNDAPSTTWYRRTVNSGPENTCQSVSTPVLLICHPSITNNSISAPQTVCEGSAPATLDGTVPLNGAGAGTYTYVWRNSINGTTFNEISGVTTEDFPGTPLTVNTWYRRDVNSSACTSTSNDIMITVNPDITAFQIGMGAQGHDTIAAGSTPAILTGTPAGGLGTFSFAWASSVDNIIFTDLATTTETYQPGALTTTTWYRRTVTSGVCSESSTFKITVLPQITGNTITADQTVCNTSTPASLTGNSPVGGDGSFRYLWEKKDASSPDWVSAEGTNNASNYQPPLLDETSQFRRNVWSGENNCCSSVSPVITITVDIMPQNITAGPDQDLLPYQFAANLQGSFNGTGTSTWKYISSEGDPEFEDPSVRNTVVRKLGFGPNVFEFNVSNNTCIAEPAEVTLTVPNLTIPQGVTPNNDGINDYFNIAGLEFTHNELVIINTGGAVVYKTDDYRSDDPLSAWTGLDLNGKEVPEGTYYFLLTINGAVDISIPDYVAHLSGFVVLRR